MGGGDCGQDRTHYIHSSPALVGRWKKVDLRARSLVRFPETPSEHGLVGKGFTQ